jgi:hypothetical protein
MNPKELFAITLSLVKKGFLAEYPFANTKASSFLSSSPFKVGTTQPLTQLSNPSQLFGGYK